MLTIIMPNVIRDAENNSVTYYGPQEKKIFGVRECTDSFKEREREELFLKHGDSIGVKTSFLSNGKEKRDQLKSERLHQLHSRLDMYIVLQQQQNGFVIGNLFACKSRKATI